jgi:hypothetical protein
VDKSNPPPPAMNPCCAAQDEIATELEDLACDPALQSCCQRDLQEQAYVARVKQQLLAHDRTDERRLLAEQAVRRDADGFDDAADSLSSASDEATPGARAGQTRELMETDLQHRRRGLL